MCFVACWKRGGFLTRAVGGGVAGQHGRGCGGGALLEGGAESSTLERLGRTEVLLHWSVILLFLVELQAAEFGHL